jgi:hypothetical protein
MNIKFGPKHGESLAQARFTVPGSQSLNGAWSEDPLLPSWLFARFVAVRGSWRARILEGVVAFGAHAVSFLLAHWCVVYYFSRGLC